MGTGHGEEAEGDILTGVEGVVGSDEDDELDGTGNARVDYLFGRDGDDLLQGGDPVAGDYLDGEEGNDHLRMQSGGILVGGLGADVFELYGDTFYAGEIKDFTKGEDKIKLDFDGKITSRNIERLLTSEGSVLDLELLGTGFEGFGDWFSMSPSVSWTRRTSSSRDAVGREGSRHHVGMRRHASAALSPADPARPNQPFRQFQAVQKRKEQGHQARPCGGQGVAATQPFRYSVSG